MKIAVISPPDSDFPDVERWLDVIEAEDADVVLVTDAGTAPSFEVFRGDVEVVTWP